MVLLSVLRGVHAGERVATSWMSYGGERLGGNKALISWGVPRVVRSRSDAEEGGVGGTTVAFFERIS